MRVECANQLMGGTEFVIGAIQQLAQLGEFPRRKQLQVLAYDPARQKYRGLLRLLGSGARPSLEL
jgi:hypothetical protein